MTDSNATKTVRVSLDDWPILRVWFIGDLRDEEFDVYLATLSEVLSRRERYGVVIDASQSGAPSISQRRKQTDYVRDHNKEIRAYNCGTAFVMNSAIIRAALNAILWLQPLPVPYEVVSTVAEADAWLAERMRDK